MDKKPIKIGLALGGGAARGLAHIGVVKALRAAGLEYDAVAGSSAGALCGAMLAQSNRIEALEERLAAYVASDRFKARKFHLARELESQRPGGSVLYNLSAFLRKGIIFGFTLAKPSLITSEEFAHHLDAILDDIDLRDCVPPLGIVATDIATGHSVLLRSGSLRKAVMASAAMPGVLPPVELDGRLLIDGGCSSRIPVREARAMGAGFIIAVDVYQDIEDTAEARSGLNVITRANAIMASHLTMLQSLEADVIIRPSLGTIHWADFERMTECIRLGEEAGRKAVPHILEALGERRAMTFWRKFWQRVSSKK